MVKFIIMLDSMTILGVCARKGTLMKKTLSLLLVLAMLAAVLPMAVSASEFPIVGTDPIVPPSGSDLVQEDDTHYSFTSLAALKKLAGQTHTTAVFATYTGSNALVVNEKLTLPANLFVVLPYSCGGMTIASGAELTVKHALQLSAPVTVNGVLTNNGTVTIFPDDGQEWSNGSLTFSAGGSYEGKGNLRIFSNVLAAPELAVPGLDLSSFEISNLKDSSQYAYCWQLKDVSGLTRLAAPAYPEWGYDHNTSDNRLSPGYISWQPAKPTQGKTLIRVYRGDSGMLCCESEWSYSASNLPDWCSVDDFLLSDPDSGVYYFTVTSKGDYITYADSETVRSDLWIYSKPSQKTASCTGLNWSWPAIRYNAPAAMANVAGYEVEFWYSPDTEAAPYPILSSHSRSAQSVFTPQIPAETLKACGTGYYYFRVRTLSDDITESCNGDWSELSPGYFYGDGHTHSYGEPTFTWAADMTCSAEFRCSCGDRQTRQCRISSKTEGDVTIYTALVDFAGKTYSDEKRTGGSALWGDVNSDGWVDSFDASLIMKYDVMLIGDNDLELSVADVSGDGWVDSYDASLILKYDVMLITKFPVEE